jgi:hypothetical protein
VCVELLRHLREVEVRAAYAEFGFSSMFAYCTTGLGMSEGEAAMRIQAARTGTRFPLVFELLAAGAVHLTAVKLLGPHLTQDAYGSDDTARAGADLRSRRSGKHR